MRKDLVQYHRLDDERFPWSKSETREVNPSIMSIVLLNVEMLVWHHLLN